jgi:predicted nucleic acid-binding protein
VTVLVDTTIWSLALRRRPDQLSDQERTLVSEWEDLAVSDRVVLIGPVRQEILSGIREEQAFMALQELLVDFRSLEILSGDYDQAARFFNICRTGGIAGTPIDMLICSAAFRHDLPIFTTDPDFQHYAHYLPIKLHFPQMPARRL